MLPGSILIRAATLALGATEVNAALDCVVVCPTACACGTLGGSIVALAEEKGLLDLNLVEALFAAGGVGLIIAEDSMISSAMGGCQAKCDVA